MSCSSHCCGAEKVFDNKEVKKALKKYHKKGPDNFTQQLIDALKREKINQLSLLDIGGGLGILQHELLKEHLSYTTDVDSSEAYISAAKELMNDNGCHGKMNFIHGDFNEHANNVEKHDIVTLSRVVCCYPDVDLLINNSISKAKQYYGLVYPTDHFLTKMVIGLMNFSLYLKRNPFRTFVHSVDKMNALITTHGFEPIYLGNALHWRIALYKRIV
jgi:predicted TPR repeat methyltransferase